MWTGSWKTIDELEECLTLDQLLKIVEAGRKKENRLFKIILASAGADVDWDDDPDNENDIADDIARGGIIDSDGQFLDFGIGYELEE